MSGRHGKKHKQNPAPNKSVDIDQLPVSPTEKSAESQPEARNQTPMKKFMHIEKPDNTSIAIGGLIIAMIAAAIYYYQLDTMRGQLDVMKKGMRADQGAWIVVKPGDNMHLVPNDRVWLDVIIENRGKTPAKNVVGRFVITPIANKEG